jgi:homocysteine S-methyltransferase
LIGGSIAPLAGVLDLDEPEGRAMIPLAHAEQATVLAGRGADLLILETFFRVDELSIAVAAVRGVTDLPIIGMMTFAHERPPHPYKEQAELLDELAELDLAAVGVNCSPGPMGALEILRHVRQVSVGFSCHRRLPAISASFLATLSDSVVRWLAAAAVPVPSIRGRSPRLCADSSPNRVRPLRSR